MGNLNCLIYVLLAINLKMASSSLVVEEEPNEKDFVSKETEDKSTTEVKSFTAEEKEKILNILENHYHAHENRNYEGFYKSLQQFLHSSEEDEKTSLEIQPTKSGGWSSGGWSNHAAQCSKVGFQCPSGGWRGEPNDARDDSTTAEESDVSKNVGWGNGWNSNSQGWGNAKKCCNHDWCVNGRCCIPTPSKQGNSRCEYNKDCCFDGICDQRSAKCFLKVGKPCSSSSECYKSSCINKVCCLGLCGSSSSRSAENRCVSDKDCCGSTSSVKCDTAAGQCKSLLGGSCNATSSACPCYDAKLDCSDTGKCCVKDGLAGCSTGSDCCVSGSICANTDYNTATPDVCYKSTKSRGFQFQGVEF